MAKKPHFHGHRDRLRRRFVTHGLDSFADYEALELLLMLLIPRRDVKPLAKELVSRYRSVRGVLDAPAEELARVEGMGPASVASLQLIRALITRYLQQTALAKGAPIDSEHLAAYCQARLGTQPIETFRVFFLDSALHLLGEEELERGTIDRAAVYPRQVIEGAMRWRSTALILAHNHPSGDPTPSDLDQTLTKAIVLAGAPLDIRVLDHLVVTADRVFSFRQAGLV